MFCNEMTRNDLIIVMAGYDLFLGFGTVNQDGLWRWIMIAVLDYTNR